MFVGTRLSGRVRKLLETSAKTYSQVPEVELATGCMSVN